MIDGKNIGALIPAAGVGRRLGGPVAKQFLSLDGVPILVRTVGLFASWDGVDEIVVAVAEGEEDAVRELLSGVVGSMRCTVLRGGKERQDSVEAALAATTADVVLVHDGVRPFASRRLLGAVASAAVASGAAIAAVRAKETIKISDGAGKILSTPERSSLWVAQTPQAFATPLLREAYAMARKERFLGTDEASLVERLGVAVAIVEGEYDNIKITTPDDLDVAAKILARVT